MNHSIIEQENKNHIRTSGLVSQSLDQEPGQKKLLVLSEGAVTTLLIQWAPIRAPQYQLYKHKNWARRVEAQAPDKAGFHFRLNSEQLLVNTETEPKASHKEIWMFPATSNSRETSPRATYCCVYKRDLPSFHYEFGDGPFMGCMGTSGSSQKTNWWDVVVVPKNIQSQVQY